jgi:nucleotide-binding universal stress UspA family protein
LDEVKATTKRGAMQVWIQHTPSPEPYQLEFKVDRLDAAKMDVDTNVVGSHGRGATYQLLMGSFSEEIICKSQYPVLVVRTHKRT